VLPAAGALLALREPIHIEHEITKTPVQSPPPDELPAIGIHPL
jgi:hypothetical protein